MSLVMLLFGGAGMAKREEEVRARSVEPRGGSVAGRCSQDIADSSDKGQALTIVDMEVPSWGFTAMDSDADKSESASLMLTISMTPRSTS